MSYNLLDQYVQTIEKETIHSLLSSDKKKLKPSAEDQKRGFILFSDDDLTRMIPGRKTDILMNAHVPSFDKPCPGVAPLPHGHTFYELVYVHRGSFHMEINNRTLVFSEGDFIILNPSVVHNVYLGTTDSSVINILLKRTLFNKSFFYAMPEHRSIADLLLPPMGRNSSDRNYIAYPNAVQNNPVLSNYLLNMLKEYTESKEYCESALEINLSGMFVELLRCRTKTQPGGNNLCCKEEAFSLSDICQYIIDHLKTITLKSAANHFHYNPRYFSKMIDKIYGKPFSGLVNDLKMFYASNMLTQTSLPITEIMHKLGYENSSHFYHLFENAYGIRPSTYRKTKNCASMPNDSSPVLNKLLH